MKDALFFVPGEPKGQPRPRAFARGGKVRIYDPGSAEAWKGLIALSAQENRPAEPVNLPTAVSLLFNMPRPRSHFGRRGLLPSAPERCATKPDIDNLGKAVLDALVNISFLRDDCLVDSLLIRKRYTENTPGCEVRVSW